MRCATLSVILPPAADLQPAAAASTLAAAAAAALSKLLETNWASCSILTVIGATRARRRASVPTALGAAVARENRLAGGTRRRRRRDATRRPGRHSAANQSAPRMGVMGNAPRRWFLVTPPEASAEGSSLRDPFRPLPEGWRAFHPSNRRSLAFAPALPPAAGNARAEATPRRWPGIGYTVRRPSYYPLLPSSAFIPLALARATACDRHPGPLYLLGGGKRPPRIRG